MNLLSKLRKQQTTITLLGEGVSGKVELYQKDNLCYVVKTYHSKERHESRKEYKNRVLYEYRMLVSLDHPNFLKAFRSEVSLDGRRVRMYTEAGSDDLSSLLRKHGKGLSWKTVHFLWKQICVGVKYLHDNGLCHRDLKLENLVMDRDFTTVKIIDLMTATESDDQVVGIVGSRRYMAPEMTSKISYDGKKVDLWSLGIIFYYILTQKFPWRHAVHSDPDLEAYTSGKVLLETKITDGLVIVASKDEQSKLLTLLESAVFLASRMLEVDPTNRYNLGQVFDDEWFKNFKGVCEYTPKTLFH